MAFGRLGWAPSGNKPNGGPKPTTETSMRRSSRRKGRDAKINKHERYRSRRGKPLGPGKAGNKSGKNKKLVSSR